MKKKILILTIAGLPAVGLAMTFAELVDSLSTKIFTPLVSILLTLALIVFFIGMIKYIQSLSEKDKKEGKALMIWGIVALFVMVAAWGLVEAIVATIGLDNTTVPTPIVLPASAKMPSPGGPRGQVFQIP